MLGATPLTHGEFVAVDIEATGSRPGSDCIIEIGAARVSGGRVVGTFSELVSSAVPVPYSIQLLTGISEEVLAGAAPVADVMRRFRAFAEGAVLVAHNYRFDLSFLDYEAEVAWGRPFPRPILCTLSLARALHPELAKHGLQHLAVEFGVSTTPTHRAGADAAACAEVFLHMLPELATRGMCTAEDVAAFCNMGSQQVLAAKLPATTHLPSAPGVYLFRDESDEVIYVGRAKNLRSRVRSYFYGGRGEDAGRTALETESVDHLRCASDLEALLVESRLVNRYHPKYNHSTQRGDASVVIAVDVGSRYPAVKVAKQAPKRGISFGPFTSVWAAETLAEQLREVYGLRRCTGRVTRDSWKRECVRRDMGACSKPCVGGIDPGEYRDRLDAALSVFDGGADAFRRELATRQQRAAAVARYEEAIRYRDGVRALDRALASLTIVHDAADERGFVILDGQADRLAIHLVRGGYLARTLRTTRPESVDGPFPELLRRALATVYFESDGEAPDDPLAYTPRQLRDVFTIATYRKQARLEEVPLGESLEETHDAVLEAVRVRLGLLTPAAGTATEGPSAA